MDIPDNYSLFLNRDQIDARVRELADEIKIRFDHKEVILVGILGGALFFMSDLARHLPATYQLDYISLSSYFGGLKSTGKISLDKDASLDYTDRDVLVVDDILDTGRTLEFVREHFPALQCRSVHCAVLLAKGAQKDSQNRADFVGFYVPEAFYIGYGLDLAERYRGLENIYSTRL